MSLKLRLATTVGKKFVTEAADTFPKKKASYVLLVSRSHRVLRELTSTQVLTSCKASLKPWKNVCSSLFTQSSWPISAWSLQVANATSFSLSQVVVRGKFGRIKKAIIATVTVMHPSIKKSHLQARKPLAPSKLPVMPAAIRPEKAPEMRDPA